MYLLFDTVFGYLQYYQTLPTSGSIQAPPNFDPNKMYRLVNNNVVELTGTDLIYYQDNQASIQETVDNTNYLKLYDYLPPNLHRDFESVKSYDFTLFGLTKRKWYQNGVKLYAVYYTTENGVENVVVRKDFTDIKDGSNFLIGIRCVVSWYNKLNNPILTKTFDVALTISQKEKLEIDRRRRTIEHMIGEAKLTPLAPVLDYIYKYYTKTLNSVTMVHPTYSKNYIDNYVNLGDYQSFITAVNSDFSNPIQYPITQYLNIIITSSSNITATVRDLVLSALYTG